MKNLKSKAAGRLGTAKRMGLLAALSWSASTAAVPLIIYDTDYGPDVDDVGALAVLHYLADRGECRILAMGNSTTNEWGPAAMDAVNHFYQRPDIPIGTYKRAGDLHSGSPYTYQIANEFPQNLGRKTAVPNVVTVYREALAKAPDASVKFVVVGFKTNLEDLLKSGADAISPLTGKELVARKVTELSDMGGAYPGGSEFNFNQNGMAAKYTFENWPTPVIFSGFEIGVNIKAGSVLKARQQAKADPVARAYELYSGLGAARESWDLTSVLIAVRGIEPYFGISAEGCVTIQSNGSNGWDAARKCGQRYLLKKMEYPQVGRTLDSILLAPVVSQAQKPDFKPTALDIGDSDGEGSTLIRPLSRLRPLDQGRILSVPAPGFHFLRITGLDGSILLSAGGIGAREYRIPERVRPGIYLASLRTAQGTWTRKWAVR